MSKNFLGQIGVNQTYISNKIQTMFIQLGQIHFKKLLTLKIPLLNFISLGLLNI